MECPHCQSPKTVKNGKDYHKDGKAIQNYLCKGCGKAIVFKSPFRSHRG